MATCHILHDQCQTWQKWWLGAQEGTCSYPPRYDYEMQGHPRAPLTAEEIRAAAKSFKKTTARQDQWHPRHYADISDPGLQLLGFLFFSCVKQQETTRHACEGSRLH
jgi:hypothetical protein